MKRNEKGRFFWLFALIATLIIMTGGLMACSSPSSPNEGSPPVVTPVVPPIDTNPPNPNDLVNVQVVLYSDDLAALEAKYQEEMACAPGTICQNLLTPGVPPGTIKVFGSLVGMNDLGNRNCYSPWQDTVAPIGTRDCVVDKSASVVGGALTLNYRVPVGALVHFAYNLGGKFRADGITVNGTPIPNVCILGDATLGYTWMVVSFMLQRDQNGAVTVVPNPACTFQQVRVEYSGDGNATDNLYDDAGFLPYNCVAEAPFYLNSSLYDVGNGARQTWAASSCAGGVWRESFYTALIPGTATRFMSFNISEYGVSREPTAPPGTEEPKLGGRRLGVYNVTTGAQIFAPVELVHITDIDLTAGYYHAWRVERIDPATGVVQLIENRFEATTH